MRKGRGSYDSLGCGTRRYGILALSLSIFSHVNASDECGIITAILWGVEVKYFFGWLRLSSPCQIIIACARNVWNEK